MEGLSHVSLAMMRSGLVDVTTPWSCSGLLHMLRQFTTMARRVPIFFSLRFLGFRVFDEFTGDGMELVLVVADKSCSPSGS